MNNWKYMLNFPIGKDNRFNIGTKSNNSKIIILSKSALEKEYTELKRILEYQKNNIFNSLEIQ